MKRFIILLLFCPIVALCQATIPFTPATIFDGDFIKGLRAQLNLSDAAFVLTGTDDPTVVAKSAPQGSMYMRIGASGGKVYVKQDAGTTTNWLEVGSGGSVSSVALSLPSIFSVSGSPVTTSGTLTGTLVGQIANSVWAGPASGANAPPTFRLLVSDDIPNLSAAKITSGQGTLSTTTTGVTIGSGTNALLSSATVDIATASGSTTGLLTSSDWTTFNGKVSASRAINTTAPLTGGGDLSADRTIAIPAATVSVDGYLTAVDWDRFNTVEVLQGVAVSTNAPVDGEVLTYNGTTTEWEPLPASGGTPTGTADTLAFFNSSGDLDSNATHGFVETTGSMKFGVTASGGTLVSTSDGSLAHGNATGGTANISATGLASYARGSVPETGGSILASGIGSQAFGLADANGNTALIRAQDEGSVSFGRAITSATITSGDGIGGGSGALAFGMASLSGASITSTGRGAMAHGEAAAAGTSISATASGAESSGQTSGGNISATGIGAKSMGSAVSGTITSTSNGSLARGTVSSSGTITASSNGSEAAGNAAGGAITASTNSGAKAHGVSLGTLSATGAGSVARGNVSASGSTITAISSGAMAAGFVDTTTTITASGAGSIASGAVTTSGSISAITGSGALAMGGFTAGSVTASGNGSHAHGSGITSGSLVASGSGSTVGARTAASGVATASNNGSSAHGDADGGSFTASGIASAVFAQALSSGTITAADTASLIHGKVSNSGTLNVLAGGIGSQIHGRADGTSSLLSTNSIGGHAAGSADSAGTIVSENIGSSARGLANTAGVIQAIEDGATAYGSAVDTGSLSSTGIGSLATGLADGTGSNISSAGTGSEAAGSADSDGDIIANGDGGKAFGFVTDEGVISSNGQSVAFGYVEGVGSQITMTNPDRGSLLFGEVSGGSHIRSQGGPAIAFGYADVNGLIDVNCAGCYVGGVTLLGDLAVYGIGSIGHGSGLDAAARYSQTFGIGHVNDSYGAMFIGQYSTSPGYTEISYVTTDPVFVVGNGADGSNRSDAFKILKNGNIFANGDVTFIQASSVEIQTAVAAGATQAININTGFPSVADVDSGAANVVTGDVTGTGSSGEITILSGGVVDGTSGNITLGPGVPSGTGTRGVISLNAHIVSDLGPGSAPTVTADCGTSPSVAGNDNTGRVTVGTGGTDASCELTFDQAWGTAPVCTVGDETTTLHLQAVATTTTLTITSFTPDVGGGFTSAPFGAGDSVVYHCQGY